MNQTRLTKLPQMRFCTCGTEVYFPDDVINRDGLVLTYECRHCGTIESVRAYQTPIRGQIVLRQPKPSLFKSDFAIIDDRMNLIY